MRTDDEPRLSDQRASRAPASENSWLVRAIAFSIRLFVVFIIASARAILLIAGDDYNNDFLSQYVPLVAQTNIAPSSDPSASGSPETRQARTSSTLNDRESSSSTQFYYVVFVGRDVGYTISR